MKSLKSVFIIFYLAGIVFLCVWQRVETTRLGYIIAGAETRLEESEKENRLLRLELSRTVSAGQMGDGLPEGFKMSLPGSIEIIEVVAPRTSSARRDEQKETDK